MRNPTNSVPALWLVLLAAAGTFALTMGTRQTMGLFMSPMNTATGLGVGSISLAFAFGQLWWGLTQPFAGAIADRVELPAGESAQTVFVLTWHCPVVVAPELTAAEKGLASGLASFDRGEYVAAMRLLTPLTNDQSLNLPSRLKALKTLAFSQCLTGAVVACRGTFERAFKLDPKFDLAPAEQGHPVWGPQFDRARKNLKIK